MNPISSGLFGGHNLIELAKATKTSNAQAESIAPPEKQKQEKSAVLSHTDAPKTAEQLHKTEQAKTAFSTQQIAQETQPYEPSAYRAAVSEFRDYMDKTPEERWFDAFLRGENLTKEQFEALPPDEKEKLLAKFEDFMEQKIEEARAKEALKEELGTTA